MKALLFRTAALALLAGGLTYIGRYDSRGAAQEPKGIELPKERGFNSGRCGHCHNVQPGAEVSQATKRSLDFIRLDENILWEKHDLHAAAHRNIVPSKEGEPANLAARMQARLRNSRKNPEYNVATAHECLACHATDTNPTAAIDIKSATVGRFLTEQGVNCSVCHGNANDWFEPHSEPTAWREKLDAGSKEKLGLLDMRDASKRAELCSSCHVGDRDKGRFVTHEMFAAGHPPLAQFETGRFGSDQPAHYRQPKDNKVLAELASKDPTLAWSRFHSQNPATHSDRAREIALGAVATFRASIQLIASEAKDAGDKRWFDLATFDCFACHHELSYPGERQDRGYPGRVAGRPAWKPGSTALLKAVLAFAAKERPLFEKDIAKVSGLAAKLEESLDKRPLGDSELTGGVAKELLAAVDALLGELKKDEKLFTKENAAKFYAAVAELAGGKEYIDFEAALPLAWALIELAKDAKGDAKVKQAAAELAKTLPTEVKEPMKQDALAGDRLKIRMKMLNEFESAKFAEAVKKFTEAVK